MGLRRQGVEGLHLGLDQATELAHDRMDTAGVSLGAAREVLGQDGQALPLEQGVEAPGLHADVLSGSECGEAAAEPARRTEVVQGQRVEGRLGGLVHGVQEAVGAERHGRSGVILEVRFARAHVAERIPGQTQHRHHVVAGAQRVLPTPRP